MTSFTDLGVPAGMVKALARKGITEPFPIQAMCIADALAGRDLTGRAPTGSGKTLAFSIPLAALVGKGRGRKPRALVLAPTRELAAQIAEELKPLAQSRDRSVAAFYGGTSMGKDRQRLNSAVDIAVACPGRLADLVRRGDADLSDVDLVVLDEADRMADMGFLPEVKRLLDMTSPNRQTLLFSATLDGDVDVLIQRYQHDPIRRELAIAESDQGEVTHLFWRAEPHRRVEITGELIRANSPAIVFTRTKRGADRVARQLKNAGVSTAAIHGDRTQGQRQRALADFGRGNVSALIATDVAARGIHVDDVGLVVHFDPPETDKDYTHRSGRTGRAGADGLVVTLVVPDKQKDVRLLQRDLDLPSGLGDVALEHVGGQRSTDLVAPVVPDAEPKPRGGGGGGRPSGGGRPRGGGGGGGGRPGGRGGGHGGGKSGSTKSSKSGGRPAKVGADGRPAADRTPFRPGAGKGRGGRVTQARS
jgi:superfamily II DNA/RNA helicase